MKILLRTPWQNAWVPLYRRECEKRGHDFKVSSGVGTADVILHGWATGEGNFPESAKHLVFLRRFELFDGCWQNVPWERVSGLIVVNSWVQKVMKDAFETLGVKTPIHLIYNSADPEKWTFKVRGHGKKIGMACHVHPKKNLPLALQILSLLPDYELHIAGEIQDACTAEYIREYAERRNLDVFLYGHVQNLNEWWEDKNYCLSTSISEGNPNNVLEAMSKGIMPLVHAWPGAEDQFRAHLFETANTAAGLITGAPYRSEFYRSQVLKDFGLRNIEKVVDLAESL